VTARALVVAALLAVLGASGVAEAQPKRFREGEVGKPVTENPPDILLYTFGVGPVIFEKFGHSALCLDYHGEYTTVCFNYGVTDFGAGAKLVWGFMRQRQKFWVEPVPLRVLERFYTHEDRSIWKQRLPLEYAQVRAIEDHLWSDLDESRRYYYYDHFYDNCTTRLRDIVDRATGGALRKNTDGLYPRTFRDLGRSGLAEFMSILVASDFLVGRDLDHHPTLWEMMFLPDVLRDEVATRLGAPPEVVNLRRGPPFPTDGPSGRPWVVLVAFVFALPLVLARLVGRGEGAARTWSVVPLVVLGLFIWAAAAISAIPAVRWNEAALLFVPTDVALLFLGERLRRSYARVRLAMVVMVSLAVAVGVFKQPLWIPALFAFLPLFLNAFDVPASRSAERFATAQGVDADSRLMNGTT
jgi:hypothetical protein